MDSIRCSDARSSTSNEQDDAGSASVVVLRSTMHLACAPNTTMPGLTESCIALIT